MDAAASGDLDQEVIEFQMCVHIFGAKSSPSVANFVVHRISARANDQRVCETLRDNFYVDDCLKACDSATTASDLILNLRNEFASNGFNLTKFISNDRSILQVVPPCDRSPLLNDVSVISSEHIPNTSALGVVWDVQTDSFRFKVKVKQNPFTRRGLLATTSTLFDPLGMIGPVVLLGKRMLQDACRLNQPGWDDPLPPEKENEWKAWTESLSALDAGLHIPRCFTDPSAVKHELHTFSDASSFAYGAVVYLRTLLQDGSYQVSFVIGKSRLAPMKTVTIPRLELTAAVLAVKLLCMVQRELRIETESFLYTDSSIVLHTIRNETKRFSTFVANRVETIRQYTKPNQWRHVPSAMNPADEASRGLTATQLVTSAKWLQGPDFLADDSPLPKIDIPEPADFASFLCETPSDDDFMRKLTDRYSDWQRLKRAVAILLKVKRLLLARSKKTNDPPQQITATDLNEAEHEILKWLQRSCYQQTFAALQKQKTEEANQQGLRPKPTRGILKSSPLIRLNPILKKDLICVGGRLSNAECVDEGAKYPIILPRSHHVTKLIIDDVHVRIGHAGRNHTLAELRSRFWVISGNSTTRHVLSKCVKCRRLRRPTEEQKMADLPDCRLDSSQPPFSQVGVDYFGPFIIKDGRKEIKRYGCIFTCLVSRAVHIELAPTLETDTFINALRRFVARRGNVTLLLSDNGTNFVGAHNDLKRSLADMNRRTIQSWAARNGMEWKFNPPSASHMGGVWERLIRSTRNVLNGLLMEHGTKLTPDELHTLLCEVECIINSRPLTTMSSDPDDLEPLTPSHALTLKPRPTYPPPGVFMDADLYARRRWRRVQSLLEVFWSRWKREFLALLQQRAKWTSPRRPLQVGDVVLIQEATPRNEWPMGRVVEVERGARTVHLKTRSNGRLTRPVSKLVLLLESEL